jgi:hypothetical protein
MVEAPVTIPAALDLPPQLPRRRRAPEAAWLTTVRRAAPTFRRWPAELRAPLDTKGGKWLVDVDGKPAFAEFAILRAFENDGWEGRWIDNYPLPPTFRTSYWDSAWNKLPREVANSPLPAQALGVYNAICVEAGDPGGAGAWDIIAWRGKEMAFVEAKRAGSSDSVRDEQLLWLDAAHRLGVPRDSLIFAEWSAV